MSCPHGVWHAEDCETCQLEDKVSSEYERGKTDGWEACETCHGIVDGKSVVVTELTRQRDELLTAANECYLMLLSEPDTEYALARAETLLREAIARVKGGA